MDKRQRARDRAARGLCIICEDGGTRITRGLCVKHHTRYLNARKDAQAAGVDLDEYDNHLIKLGMLLPSRKGKRLDPGENEFADALLALLGQSELADEAIEEAVKKQAEADPSKRTRRKILRAFNVDDEFPAAGRKPQKKKGTKENGT